jgi:hypothetical protein
LKEEDKPAECRRGTPEALEKDAKALASNTVHLRQRRTPVNASVDASPSPSPVPQPTRFNSEADDNWILSKPFKQYPDNITLLDYFMFTWVWVWERGGDGFLSLLVLSHPWNFCLACRFSPVLVYEPSYPRRRRFRIGYFFEKVRNGP